MKRKARTWTEWRNVDALGDLSYQKYNSRKKASNFCYGPRIGGEWKKSVTIRVRVTEIIQTKRKAKR